MANLPPSRILNYLQKMFNLKAGQSLPQLAALSGSTSTDPFQYNQTQYSEDRQAKMREYDAMDMSSSDINVALNTYAEESTQFSLEQKRTIWATSEDPSTVDIIHTLFDELDMEEKIFGLTRHIAKYGEAFVFPVINAKSGVQDLIVPHPSLVTIKFDENDYNKVIGYRCEALDIVQPSEMGYENPPMPKDIQARSPEGFSPWDWVHFRIKGSDMATHYGYSMIESARKTWKVLAMLETAVALYRINKAGNRLLFMIDPGTANPSESRKILEDYIKAIRQTPFLSLKDPARGGDASLEDFLVRYKQNQFLEDIFMLKPKDSESSVSVLDIPVDIGAIEDLEYWRTKFRTALGIPKAYFDGDISGWGANKALAQQDVQFARKMERVQKSVVGGVNILCGLHLLYIGKEKFSFTIHMEPPSALGLLQRLETQKAKLDQAIEAIGAADTFGFDRVKWAVLILQEVMEMSKDEIKELMVRIPEPAQLTPGALPQTVTGSIGATDTFAQGEGAPIGGAMATETPGVATTEGSAESFAQIVEAMEVFRRKDDDLVTTANFNTFIENMAGNKPCRVRYSRDIAEDPYQESGNGQEKFHRIIEDVSGEETNC